MLFHQQGNSIGAGIYNGYLYRNFNWLLHMHKAFEFALVLEGEVSAVVGQNQYTVKAGESLLIMPFQVHAYTPDADALFFISVFSGNYVPEFAKIAADREPCCALFRPSPESSSFICHSVGLDKAVPTPAQKQVRQHLGNPPPLFLSAYLYTVCAEFEKTAVWQEKEQNSELIYRILSYIEKNYTEDISLATLADSLSYEYHYLSRLFHETLKVPFRTLVNQYRCELAKEKLLTTEEPIASIAMNCGFQSIRSFNRSFSDFSGVSPSVFRSH